MTTALTFIMASICGPGGSRDGWVTYDPDDSSLFCHKILISPPLKSAGGTGWVVPIIFILVTNYRLSPIRGG